MDNTPNPTPDSSTRLNSMLAIGLVAIVGLMALVFLQRQSTNPEPVSPQPSDSELVTSPSPLPSVSPPVESTQPALSPTVSPTAVRTIEVKAGSFYFAPAEIRVKKGETVKIELTSRDMMHNLVIDELKVNLPIVQAGDTGTVEFTANQAGRFEYYCGVGQHRANGQVGTLIVE